MSTYEFKEDAGKFITEEAAQKLRNRRNEDLENQGLKPEEFVHSQFFGKKKILELLENAGSDCVGLRLGFGHTEDATLKDRLVVYAIDKAGLVLGNATPVLAEGPLCPTACGQGGFP